MRRVYGLAPKGGKKSTKDGAKSVVKQEEEDLLIELQNEPETVVQQDDVQEQQQPAKRPPTVKIPNTKGVNISVIGAICWSGVIDLSLRTPQVNKKREITGKREALNEEASVEINAEHFATFIHNVMDILDKNNMKGASLVMDSASIHKTEFIRMLIKERGYILLYLLPCSPFLNPIAEYWAKMKLVFRRQDLAENETVEHRLKEAGFAVKAEDIQGCIQYAFSYFPRCLNREEL